MRNFFYLLLAAVGVAAVSFAPASARDDEKPAPATAAQANLSRAFISEIKALTEAETMLKTISDAKSAGQAVQNMNLMFGLPEDMGLRLKPSAF